MLQVLCQLLGTSSLEDVQSWLVSASPAGMFDEYSLAFENQLLLFGVTASHRKRASTFHDTCSTSWLERI